MSGTRSAVAAAAGMVEATVVILTGPREVILRRESIDPATLGASSVLCETIVSVISPGTELAAYTGQPALREGAIYPRLQGYCNVARVLAVGSGVSSLIAGDRILSFSSHRSHFTIDAADVLVTLPRGV